MSDFHHIVAKFLKENPHIEWVETILFGIAGNNRGKLIPADNLSKITNDGLCIPHSACLTRINGGDINELPLIKYDGDPDAVCMPIPYSLKPVFWSQNSDGHITRGQILLQLHNKENYQLSPYQPRNILQNILQRFHGKGLKPVIATELEFYIRDRACHDKKYPQPPIPPNSDQRLCKDHIYDLDIVTYWQEMIDDIKKACIIQDIPCDTVIAEYGAGQFEINLQHHDNILKVADDAILLKRIIKHIARQYGYEACFMAKPYQDSPGSGLHIHLSLYDTDGNNIFASDSNYPNDQLLSAIAGVLEYSNDFMAIFAPHLNSYRRFQTGMFVPMQQCWGYDNRAVAIRVPSLINHHARFEHRISGVDANPYLVIAALLASIDHGMSNKLSAPAAAINADDIAKTPLLTHQWYDAIQNFQQSSIAKDTFGDIFHHVYHYFILNEFHMINAQISDVEYDMYLNL